MIRSAAKKLEMRVAKISSTNKRKIGSVNQEKRKREPVRDYDTDVAAGDQENSHTREDNAARALSSRNPSCEPPVSRKQRRSFVTQHSQLARHADLVPDIPSLHDHSVAHSACGHSGDLELLLSRFCAKSPAGVLRGDGPAGKRGVAFLDYVVECDLHLR